MTAAHAWQIPSGVALGLSWSARARRWASTSPARSEERRRRGL